MPKRTKVYGTYTNPRPRVRFSVIYTNGSTYTTEASQYTPITRRAAETATIYSEKGKDGSFRPCFHQREVYLSVPLTRFRPFYTAQYPSTPINGHTVKTAYIYNMQYDHHAYYFNGFYSAIGTAKTTMSLAAVQWDSLSSTALQTMLPSFHSNSSWLNFVLELKDFRKLAKRAADDLGRKFNPIGIALGYRHGRKTMKNLSNAYLSYQFGWGPLYRDVVAFIQLIFGFYAKFQELLRRENVPQQSYWGCNIAGTGQPGNTMLLNGINGDGPTGGYQATGSDLKVRVRCIIEAQKEIRYSATVRYRYQCPPELFTVMGSLKAAADQLGISANPSIIWNAIPFSFIIDWFFNVNRWLDGLRVDNIDFKTEILDFCHSAKVERRVRYELAGMDYHYASGASLHPFETSDSCDLSIYERKKGLPNYLTAMQSSGLNWREFSLAGALVRGNLRK